MRFALDIGPGRHSGETVAPFPGERLIWACRDLARADAGQVQAGITTPTAQAALADEIAGQMEALAAQAGAEDVALCIPALARTLCLPEEIARLKALLDRVGCDVTIQMPLQHQSRALADHYAAQVMAGRLSSLETELSLLAQPQWWDAALSYEARSNAGPMTDTQAPPFWLDFMRLYSLWADVFGAASITLCPAGGNEESPPSAATLTRARLFNGVLTRYMEVTRTIVPQDLCRSMLDDMAVDGPPLDPGALSPLARHFEADNAKLIASCPALAEALRPPPAAPDWQEADPLFGFRATQYLTAFHFRIRKHATPIVELRETAAKARDAQETFDRLLSPEGLDAAQAEATRQLREIVRAKYDDVMSGTIRPHNDLGAVNEEEKTAPYPPAPPRNLPGDSTGNVIVGCMKNEAPYIVEWVAYHRAIGVDNFLIYTNGCEDGTSELLDRLQEMGVLQHRNNDDWKGNSPQQHALNQSLKEPVIRNAEWIIHIDVDEFMNVRTGDGTLDALFAAVPDATNIAMTWRLFGHDGVTELNDDFVIDQFESCAPKFCPKPHTVWGFKTMFRNIGAYEKISCHRPNKLREDFADRVKWVNGSGKDITKAVAQKGWRSSKKSIGYDLLQLNHYALRSAESFLIKRQRGRALHVDRSIGLNYWIRMDWCDYRDVTIKRNVPRLRAEYDRLLADPELARWHRHGMEWHRAKARELRAKPEFHELYTQALAVDLNETERVAYALALDLET